MQRDKPKMSQKYKGIITREQGRELDSHIDKMRNEWNII